VGGKQHTLFARVREGAIVNRFAGIVLASAVLAGSLSCSDDPIRPEPYEDKNLISLLRRVWYEASQPVDPENHASLIDLDAFADSFYWYNPSQRDQLHLITTRWDLIPTLTEGERTPVESIFLKTFGAGDDDWYGILRGFDGGLDLSDAIEFEIWINDFQPDSLLRDGVLHLDFGYIDEDFFETELNELNDELGNAPAWTIDNDTGFRTASNSWQGEDCEFPYTFDNYLSSPFDLYPGINCRRGNAVWDSEDLNRNGKLDEANAYYTFTVPLDSTAAIDVQRDYTDIDDYWNDWPEADYPNRKKAWRKYILPITEARAIAQSGTLPDLDNITHMRIWIEGAGRLTGLRGQVIEITRLRIKRTD
jgi:hypothetical protein